MTHVMTNSRHGLGTAYALGERLKREIARKPDVESKKIMDRYSALIGQAIERHSFNLPKGKSRFQTK